MISDNMAEAITRHSTQSFEKMVDPSKITIQRIFRNHWEEFLNDPQVKKNGIRTVVIREVDKMMSCGTIDAGFEVYQCPNCHKNHIICYTCKSRFCNSCGVQYAKERAKNISEYTLDVPHRHVVFTLDERLRVLFQADRKMLDLLFDAAKDTLFYVFDKMNGKKKTFIPGFILTLHTFGRALNWNPHIHCLLTEGGIDDQNNYKPVSYINYQSLRKSFMKCLLDRMKAYYAKKDERLLKAFKTLVSTLYNEKTNGFYVNAPKMKTKQGKDAIVNYIIRYTGRPVMAQSRILDYDKKKKMIHYYYEDHKTEERIEVEESVIELMKKLIIHIPDEQFKMIRYYGIYATCNHRKKPKVREMLKKAISKFKEILSYRRQLIQVFNTDPLLCCCGHYMEFVDYYIPPSRKNGDTYDEPT